MHDIAVFRSDLERISQRLSARGFTVPVEAFRELDARRRAAITETEQLKARKNEQSAAIGQAKRTGADTAEAQAAVREMSEQIAVLDEQVRALDEQFRDLLAGIPNVPQASVPVGTSAESNVEIRRVGAAREYSFTPKPHWELGTELGILDLERAAKITGARFALYWDLGAKLERALANFMLDVHTLEHGYTEVLPPVLVNSQSLFGTGNLPKFGADLFQCRDTDFWLAPTAEVPVTNIFRDETLDADRLPISLCAATSCFRSEAGSHGRDVRGIFRQHQFQKVELVKFTRPEQSEHEHERLTSNAETILARLELPFRTMLLSTGDMGFSSAKTYDLEVWLPGQNAYREISSCSNFEAFQARRAGIKCKSGKEKSEFVHTLNGSGLAVGRTWIAIVENYQQEDGSVLIPKALQPYMNAEKIERGAGLR